jgi:predicted nucleic acid-binding protein
VRIEEAERDRGVALEALGFSPTDALHVACAERAKADILLTTDDPFVSKAARYGKQLHIRVANPLVWLQEGLRT